MATTSPQSTRDLELTSGADENLLLAIVACPDRVGPTQSARPAAAASASVRPLASAAAFRIVCPTSLPYK
ncbi:hypothetical protein [Hoeflea marina]|uniref:hypothetical protein n=1 Tax=Hoeflea marina TaxID=274592 RepID=UPI0011B3D263|nr:hypothetical protein [Hoeflea marina]